LSSIQAIGGLMERLLGGMSAIFTDILHDLYFLQHVHLHAMLFLLIQYRTTFALPMLVKVHFGYTMHFVKFLGTGASMPYIVIYDAVFCCIFLPPIFFIFLCYFVTL
jgi:hypothetical protein